MMDGALLSIPDESEVKSLRDLPGVDEFFYAAPFTG
jgi:hypothetical protein